MKVFYPALVTAAIFFAAIVVNLNERDYGNVLFISLLAIPSIILQVFLTQKNFDILAYILILVPIILVYVGYSIGIHNKETFIVKQVAPVTKVTERIEAKMT